MKELDFEAIFERHHQALYRFCLSIVGNPEDAREALQNTMVKALRALPREKREIKLRPWLYRVAHNESIDVLRRRREGVELDVELAGSGGGLAEEAEVRERLRALIADLRELPERQRAALVMRELGGLEFDEIGAALDASASTARQTVYEARLSLQQLKAGREMSCAKVRWELSADDGRVTRRRDIQAHLRDCAECRSFQEAIATRRRDLAALAPLPAASAAGVLHAALGAKAAGGGIAAAGGVLGKVAATSPLVKSVATVAVVAAIAVPAADRSGLIHAGLFDRGSAHSQSSSPTGTDSDSTATPPDQPAPAVKDATPTGSLKPGDAASGGPAVESDKPTNGDAAQTASDASGPAAAGNAKTGAREGDLPAASAHGQETAAAHGGGRSSAGSKGGKHTHAPKGGPEHGHAKASPAHGHAKPNPSHDAPEAGGKNPPPTRPPVQGPAIPPDKEGQAPFETPKGNPAPEQADAGQTKEAR